MIASGEIRLFATTMRRMPVLAQGQTSQTQMSDNQSSDDLSPVQISPNAQYLTVTADGTVVPSSPLPPGGGPLNAAQQAYIASSIRGSGSFVNTVPFPAQEATSGANYANVIINMNNAGFVTGYAYYDPETGDNVPAYGTSVNPIYTLGEFLNNNPQFR
jgi:hypothetical protein